MSITLGDIRNASGEKLDYTLHAGTGGCSEVVVIGHGVTGNKDRPLIIALAEELANRGIHCVRFSFAGNGASEGTFQTSCISKEVEDLGSVLDALDGYAVTYAGHSMGAAVGVLRAANDKRIKRLISLAGMVHTQAFAEREFGDVTPDEGLMWDNPECPLSSLYMEDMSQIKTVLPLAKTVQIPWLLVHGTEDDVVPLQDALDIYPSIHEPKELFQIEGADHVFDGEATKCMSKKVADWVC